MPFTDRLRHGAVHSCCLNCKISGASALQERLYCILKRGCGIAIGMRFGHTIITAPCEQIHDPDITSDIVGYSGIEHHDKRLQPHFREAVLRDAICDKSDDKGSAVLYNARVRLKISKFPLQQFQRICSRVQRACFFTQNGESISALPAGVMLFDCQALFQDHQADHRQHAHCKPEGGR